MSSRLLLALSTVVLLSIVMISCSQGPAPPKPGTPAFFWAAANAAYRAGDYVRASDNLSQLTSGDSEYKPQAEVMLILLSSGMAGGFNELADAYQAGGRLNRQNSGLFRKQMTAIRASAGQAALQFAETFHHFQDAVKDPNIVLPGFPTGSVADPLPFGKVTKGMLLSEGEAESLRTAMLRRGVVLSAARLVGATGDPSKATELFKSGSMARDQFLRSTAQELYDRSATFGPTQLDQPQRAKVLCTEALEALASVPPNKDTKELEAKIQKSIKKLKLL